MTAAFAPGSDVDTAFQYPEGGAGGVFARVFQGATPKYALNAGRRGDTQHRATMARMFVDVPNGQRSLFMGSIADRQVRANLAPQLTGIGVTPGAQGQRVRSPTIADTGYVDFILTSAQQSLQEKVQVTETLSDNYVAFFFGQSAPLWSYQGFLINSVQDDQVSNMYRLYLSILRGTQLARRNLTVSLKYDSFVVLGAMTNIQTVLNAQNELLVPFSFQLLVKRIFFTNTTANWRPTSVEGDPDPLAAAIDQRRGTQPQPRHLRLVPPRAAEEDAAPTQGQPVGNTPNGAVNRAAANNPNLDSAPQNTQQRVERTADATGSISITGTTTPSPGQAATDLAQSVRQGNQLAREVAPMVRGASPRPETRTDGTTQDPNRRPGRVGRAA